MYGHQENLTATGFHPWGQELGQSYIPGSPYDDIPRHYAQTYPAIKFERTHNTRSKAANKKIATKKLRKSVNQLQVLKNYFMKDPKPGREPVLKLAATTGLNFFEVRNWFRNARLRNKDDLMDDKKFEGKSDESENSYGEVSSSTGNSLSVSDEILRMWTQLDESTRLELLPKLFISYESNSNERYEAIKTILRQLSTRERSAVHSYVKPRGPYRCSGDKSLSKTTVLERAKDAWYELERRFGANKNEKQDHDVSNSLSLNLDKDMLEGLKSLFQAHRDYLHILAKDMGIDTSDNKEARTKPVETLGPMHDMIQPQMTNSLEMMPSYPNVSPYSTVTNNPLSITSAAPIPITPAAPTPIYANHVDYIPYQMQATTQHYPANSMQSMMSGPYNRMLFSNGPPPTYSPSSEHHFKPYYPPIEDYNGMLRPFAFSAPDRLSLNHVQNVNEPKQNSFFKDFQDMSSQLAFNNYTNPNDTEITQNIYMMKMEVKVNSKGATSHSQINSASSNLPQQKQLIEPPVL